MALEGQSLASPCTACRIYWAAGAGGIIGAFVGLFRHRGWNFRLDLVSFGFRFGFCRRGAVADTKTKSERSQNKTESSRKIQHRAHNRPLKVLIMSNSPTNGSSEPSYRVIEASEAGSFQTKLGGLGVAVPQGSGGAVSSQTLENIRFLFRLC